MPKTTQLRTYTVRVGMLDEWVERWRAELVPLRLELDFAIRGAWVDRERNQFVWLISYEGPEMFAGRNALYWASSGAEGDESRSGRIPGADRRPHGRGGRAAVVITGPAAAWLRSSEETFSQVGALH
ncbi:hypothetical protein [Streptomyces sp. NPDC050428]|uniref:hypothetical protein n=1 Tax=Streptomyces sp. NPDC050428 TaxID=3155757 RepID=UPI003430A392